MYLLLRVRFPDPLDHHLLDMKWIFKSLRYHAIGVWHAIKLIWVIWVALAVVEKFVAENDFIDFLAKDPAVRSNTSVCLTLDLSPEQIKAFVALLEKENVALDIGGYRDAPPSIRIWCGATVETADVEALMPWLKWAFDEVKGN